MVVPLVTAPNHLAKSFCLPFWSCPSPLPIWDVLIGSPIRCVWPASFLVFWKTAKLRKSGEQGRLDDKP